MAKRGRVRRTGLVESRNGMRFALTYTVRVIVTHSVTDCPNIWRFLQKFAYRIEQRLVQELDIAYQIVSNMFHNSSALCEADHLASYVVLRHHLRPRPRKMMISQHP